MLSGSPSVFSYSFCFSVLAVAISNPLCLCFRFVSIFCEAAAVNQEVAFLLAQLSLT